MRVGGLTLAWALAAAVPQAVEDFPLTDFLRRTIQLSSAQIASLEAGEVVTKQLPADEKADVAVFGAVRIAASPETYAARLRDITSFRKSPSVMEIGRFSETPAMSDVASLTLEKEDFAAAKNCRPGKCDLKLARSAIQLMHAQIDWSAPDASDRAAAVLRMVMVDFVVAYRKGGATALATYLDKEHPVDASSEFKTLLESTRYLIDYAPSFHAYLASYPNATLEGVEDFFYWVKEQVGPKLTVSVHHVSLWRDPRGPLFVSSKQIYSSHFVRVGLDLVAVVPSRESPGVFYLLDLYRSRIDPPGGLIGGVITGKIRGSVENTLKDSLKAAKTRTLAQP
jgi:hypothetical protein